MLVSVVSVFLSGCLSSCLSVGYFVCLLVCLFVYLFVFFTAYLLLDTLSSMTHLIIPLNRRILSSFLSSLILFLPTHFKGEACQWADSHVGECSVRLSVWLPVFLSVCWLFCLFVSLFICLFVCLFHSISSLGYSFFYDSPYHSS